MVESGLVSIEWSSNYSRMFSVEVSRLEPVRDLHYLYLNTARSHHAPLRRARNRWIRGRTLVLSCACRILVIVWTTLKRTAKDFDCSRVSDWYSIGSMNGTFKISTLYLKRRAGE